jgi:hypothetical protein
LYLTTIPIHSKDHPSISTTVIFDALTREMDLFHKQHIAHSIFSNTCSKLNKIIVLKNFTTKQNTDLYFLANTEHVLRLVEFAGLPLMILATPLNKHAALQIKKILHTVLDFDNIFIHQATLIKGTLGDYYFRKVHLYNKVTFLKVPMYYDICVGYFPSNHSAKGKGRGKNSKRFQPY